MTQQFTVLLTLLCVLPAYGSLSDDASTLVNFTLQNEKSSRSDHQIWHQLATPVCQILINPNTLQPREHLEELSAQQHKQLGLLTSYAQQQNTLPASVQHACKNIADLYQAPRRVPGFEHQTFSASAISEMVKRSHVQEKKLRMTRDEHKRKKRLRQEEHCALRKQMRMKRHLSHQAGRLTHHKKTDMMREQKRNAQESLELRKRKRAAQKKQSKEDQNRINHAQATLDKKEQERKRLERVRQELLKKKR